MSFIDNLVSLASNTPLKRLAPANRDAIYDTWSSLSKHSRTSNIYKQANREGRSLTDVDFQEKASDAAAKALEYEADGKKKKLLRQNDEVNARGTIAQHHQTALGREAGAVRDGSKLDDADKLRKFRELNNEKIKEHTKGISKARKELGGHAKDYYFSGDLGTNAMRWGATGAAYGAVAVGTRALTGGSATTNNQGQRDIAGIPFI